MLLKRNRFEYQNRIKLKYFGSVRFGGLQSRTKLKIAGPGPGAPFPLSWGTRSPCRTFASGFAQPSSAKKHPTIVNTRKAIKNSTFLTCKTRTQTIKVFQIASEANEVISL